MTSALEDKLKAIARQIKEKHRKKNFCEEYRLNNSLIERLFNNKYNQSDKRWILEKDITKDLDQSFEKHIRDNGNLIIICSGRKNEGKSEGIIRKGKDWLNKFEKIKGYRPAPNPRVSFNDSELAEDLANAAPGEFLIRDETPRTSGKGGYDKKKRLGNIVDTGRASQISMAFINPRNINEIKEIGDINFLIQTAGICREKGLARYIVYSRLDDATGGEFVPLGHIILEKHNDEEFRKEYEERKMNFINETLARQGLDTMYRNPEKMVLDGQRLIQYIKRKFPKSKISSKKLDSIITLYNSPFFRNQQYSEMIGGTNQEDSETKAFVELLLDNKYIVSKILEVKGDNFYDYDGLMQLLDESEAYQDEDQDGSEVKIKLEKIKDQSFPDFVFNYFKKKGDLTFAWLGKWLSLGISYDAIYSNAESKAKEGILPELSNDKINKMCKKIRSYSNLDEGLGYLWELYVGIYDVGIPPEKIYEVVAASSHDCDIYWDGVIYSCKYRLRKANTNTFNQKEDLYPEYKRAKKEGKKYFLKFANGKWDDGKNLIYTLELDPCAKNLNFKVEKTPKKKLKM